VFLQISLILHRFYNDWSVREFHVVPPGLKKL